MTLVIRSILLYPLSTSQVRSSRSKTPASLQLSIRLGYPPNPGFFPQLLLYTTAFVYNGIRLSSFTPV